MNSVQQSLSEKTCKPCEGGVAPLAAPEIKRLLGKLDGWKVRGDELCKTYSFKNYYETMAFVNATAWVSHGENHHPDLEVGYKECRVR